MNSLKWRSGGNVFYWALFPFFILALVGSFEVAADKPFMSIPEAAETGTDNPERILRLLISENLIMWYLEKMKDCTAQKFQTGDEMLIELRCFSTSFLDNIPESARYDFLFIAALLAYEPEGNDSIQKRTTQKAAEAHHMISLSDGSTICLGQLGHSNKRKLGGAKKLESSDGVLRLVSWSDQEIMLWTSAQPEIWECIAILENTEEENFLLTVPPINLSGADGSESEVALPLKLRLVKAQMNNRVNEMQHVMQTLALSAEYNALTGDELDDDVFPEKGLCRNSSPRIFRRHSSYAVEDFMPVDNPQLRSQKSIESKKLVRVCSYEATHSSANRRVEFSGKMENLIADPSTGTAFLGRYVCDTGNVIRRLNITKQDEIDEYKAAPGMFQLLNVSEELAGQSKNFWEEYNLPWLEQMTKEGVIFVYLSDPEDPINSNSLFRKEFEYLLNREGYAHFPEEASFIPEKIWHHFDHEVSDAERKSGRMLKTVTDQVRASTIKVVCNG